MMEESAELCGQKENSEQVPRMRSKDGKKVSLAVGIKNTMSVTQCKMPSVIMLNM
jgi:hypothetical protein